MIKNRHVMGLVVLSPALALAVGGADAPGAATSGGAAASATQRAASAASAQPDAVAASADGLSFQGIVELEERNVAFEFAGRITALHVERGDTLAQGALIAELDPALEEQGLAARRNDVAAAQAQLALLRAGTRREEIRSMAARVRAAKAVEELLGRKLTRERALVTDGVGVVAAVDDLEGQRQRATADREGLEHQLRVLEAGVRSQEIDTAVARLDSAETAVKLSEARLARYRVTAPLKGAVLDVHFWPGEVVAAGAPVVTIGDRTRPYVDVFVPQARVGRLTNGQRAQVRVDSRPEAFAAQVENIGRTTEFTPRFLFSERERANLVVRVRLRVTDPEEQLPIGVPAQATFSEGTSVQPVEQP